MPSLFPQLFTFSELAPLALRLVLAVVFIIHGYSKLFKNFSGTVQFFEAVGFKPAVLWVFVAGAVEFFGGILLVLGFLVQPVAALLAIEMLVAIWKVQFKKGFAGGYEFDLSLLAMALALLVLGPGALSFDLPL
ncbi:MAG: DoxX family protein [bacterium]|nr:DoxX family protein [bacterium]